ncbi:MAG: Bax inhibitor-1/YccA family protein [Propionibacteriales bacterium]|nr:Bax inhibitor-1/YccA family protein [Propionibacteriales bacterium]
MQSNNPVFNRSEGFNGRGAATTRSADPSQWKIDLDGSASQPSPTHTTGRGTGFMTIESTVEKTALTLGVVVATAAAAWFLIGDISTDQAAVQKAFGFAFAGAIVGFGLSLVNSFKKIISPALVLAYAAAEGVFVGAFSKVVSGYVGDPTIVFQAVLATMVAFFATLGAYKFFNIQVTDKFRKVVTISMFAFVGVMLVNFVLSITGVLESGGLRSFENPGLSLVVSAVAVVLAVFMLIMDFDFVERGVEAGLPERESWRAAFGLTVTLVWLYIEILRILAILRGQD